MIDSNGCYVVLKNSLDCELEREFCANQAELNVFMVTLVGRMASGDEFEVGDKIEIVSAE